ncbi:hypothetical protein BJ508DRAFT_365918 [Ascobolus immersus RN42]|uniref:Uncharacterized protein n=1 Tax=Ascobolus immersus RN42 TaxID=1160509 RepID=A0A3N4HMF0_ASCIM|nr:hypothetical protein BJ508DRAFT_365918 [Ascobolus immersus RN42]
MSAVSSFITQAHVQSQTYTSYFVLKQGHATNLNTRGDELFHHEGDRRRGLEWLFRRSREESNSSRLSYGKLLGCPRGQQLFPSSQARGRFSTGWETKVQIKMRRICISVASTCPYPKDVPTDNPAALDYTTGPFRVACYLCKGDQLIKKASLAMSDYSKSHTAGSSQLGLERRNLFGEPKDAHGIVVDMSEVWRIKRQFWGFEKTGTPTTSLFTTGTPPSTWGLFPNQKAVIGKGSRPLFRKSPAAHSTRRPHSSSPPTDSPRVTILRNTLLSFLRIPALLPSHRAGLSYPLLPALSFTRPGPFLSIVAT